MTTTINIIGCGRAAGSLARLWRQAGCVVIGDVLNRRRGSAERAVEAVGQGRAVAQITDMRPADYWLIGTGDGEIGPMAQRLADSRADLEGSLVFHLAGRFGLRVLAPAAAANARVAALHPVRSLTHDALSLEDFEGTACVAEGSPEALAALQPLVTSIRATWLPVERLDRGLYHAAVAVVSNITKAVAWKAQKWQERAGLSPETAAEVTYQLLNSTMDDLFRAGARQSITGPVVRGDTSTIEAHLRAIAENHPEDLDVYRILARTVLELAQERGDLDAATLRRFQDLFRAHSDS
jgi:predicted short-subunit dehydrogenase-like oxidoreductase (DUF2520 family)